MSPQDLVAGPYLRRPSAGVGRMMAAVMLALVPATAFGFYRFGWPAIFLFGVCLAAALLTEALCLLLARRPVAPALGDGSALLTGWLLALSLPPWSPWWLGAVGSAFAIAVVKQVFGGVGQNPFNPAMAARVALLVSFPLPMTSWPAAAPLGSAQAPGLAESFAITFGGASLPDAVTSASWLDRMGTELDRGAAVSEVLAQGYSLAGNWLGTGAGSLGETSALLLLAGGLVLVALRVIHWQVPAGMLAGVALPAALLNLLDPGAYPGPAFHLAAGGLMLGAFFIATDPVTCPSTRAGRLLFGLGCGLLTYVIRTWGGFPEGVAFAVLLMNAATPLIDHYVRPRRHGRRLSGAPLDLPSTAARGRRP